MAESFFKRDLRWSLTVSEQINNSEAICLEFSPCDNNRSTSISLAQITVADDNNVGIGNSAPESKLAVNSAGASHSTFFVENSNTAGGQRAGRFYKSASGTSGGIWSYGQATAIALTSGDRLVSGYFSAYNADGLSSRRSYGVYSLAGNATDGFNYSVWARLAGVKHGAALFATTGNDYEIALDTFYAGYFRGRVYVEEDIKYEGNLTKVSDINLKKDIEYISDEKNSQIAKLNTLSAIRYRLKTPADLNNIPQRVKDTLSIDPMSREYNEPKYLRKYIGFSAQDVQKVYPELVKQEPNGYLSMNYIGLIPFLVEAIKEQEAEIELLKKEIQDIKEILNGK